MSDSRIEIEEITDDVLAQYFSKGKREEDNIEPDSPVYEPVREMENKSTAPGQVSPRQVSPRQTPTQNPDVPTVDLSPGPFLRRPRPPVYYDPKEPMQKKKKKKSSFDWGWVLIPGIALLYFMTRGTATGQAPSAVGIF